MNAVQPFSFDGQQGCGGGVMRTVSVFVLGFAAGAVIVRGRAQEADRGHVRNELLVRLGQREDGRSEFSARLDRFVGDPGGTGDVAERAALSERLKSVAVRLQELAQSTHLSSEHTARRDDPISGVGHVDSSAHGQSALAGATVIGDGAVAAAAPDAPSVEAAGGAARGDSSPCRVAETGRDVEAWPQAVA